MDQEEDSLTYCGSRQARRVLKDKVPSTLTFRQIEVARAVVITASPAGAAKLLDVSALGIGRLMKYTEKTLGMRLFDRRGGRLAPSEPARDIFEQINVRSRRETDAGVGPTNNTTLLQALRKAVVGS